MNKDLSDHLVNDKDNKFHATSVAQRLREVPGMTISLYLEVQMVWERLMNVLEDRSRVIADYTALVSDLKNLLEEHN